MKRTTSLASARFSGVCLATAALAALPLSAFAQQLPDYSYVGLGGGDDGFVINSKITLGDNFSIRPSVATDFDFDDSEDVSYLLPITYDLNAVDGGGRVYPFVGAGLGGDLGDDSTIDFAITGGVDYRFANRWVANGAVNYLPFADGDEVDFSLGVGYTFGGSY
ncbi:outer membrane insertion C-terminal signal domain protein [Synechococcus sp. PCC 7335]|uniref:YadA-like family protein n=1 Tax=Synechococcus sp. (strain ATCC 29403 / PCC 7335) TaxID=91464 RepID=UPI00017ED2B5|nr:YadA-like family protein [Synechococcus sp. PCC 7335]EDX83444.1 outer membrane insertion C-terminal signal domain protein [Synechococcus sp. PCC 7335]